MNIRILAFSFLWMILGIQISVSFTLASEAVFISESGNEDEYLDGMIEATSVALSSYFMGKSYSKMRWLVDEEASANNVLTLLESMKDSSVAFDFYSLTHGYPNEIILHKDILNDYDLRGLEKIQKLRTVYMMNCYGDTLSDDFIALGAQVTLGRYHSPDNKEVGINFPYDFPFFMNHYQKQIRHYWAIKNWRRVLVQVDESQTVRSSHHLAISDIVWISEMIQYFGMKNIIKAFIPSSLLNGQEIDFSETDVRRATKTIRGNPEIKVTSTLH